MNGGQLQTNQLQDINWGGLDYESHASRAPQLMSCNCYVCVSACVYAYCVCVYLLSHTHVQG